MSLKRNGAYRRAWLSAFFALLFLGYEGVVIAHLVALGNWSSLFGSNILVIIAALILFVGLLVDLFAFSFTLLSFITARSLRNIRVNVQSAAPPATFQPDLGRAIRDGETLTITSRHTSNGRSVIVLCMLLFAFILFAFIFGGSEASILSLVPHAADPLSSLIGALFSNASLPALDLSVWDWLASALPLVLALVCVLPLALSGQKDRVIQIVADDRGITKHATRRREVFIPWSDIRIFLRGAESSIDSVDGGYTLWGREHFLQFRVFSAAEIRKAQEFASQPNRSVPEPSYTFDGSHEQYLADLRRLLATVRARSGEPLRARAGATQLLNWGKGRFPTLAVELEDALAAPVAGPSWQPPQGVIDAVAPKGSFAALIVLKPRLSTARITAGTILFLLAPISCRNLPLSPSSLRR